MGIPPKDAKTPNFRDSFLVLSEISDFRTVLRKNWIPLKEL